MHIQPVFLFHLGKMRGFGRFSAIYVALLYTDPFTRRYFPSRLDVVFCPQAIASEASASGWLWHEFCLSKPKPGRAADKAAGAVPRLPVQPF